MNHPTIDQINRLYKVDVEYRAIHQSYMAAHDSSDVVREANKILFKENIRPHSSRVWKGWLDSGLEIDEYIESMVE